MHTGDSVFIFVLLTALHLDTWGIAGCLLLTRVATYFTISAFAACRWGGECLDICKWPYCSELPVQRDGVFVHWNALCK